MDFVYKTIYSVELNSPWLTQKSIAIETQFFPNSSEFFEGHMLCRADSIAGSGREWQGNGWGATAEFKLPHGLGLYERGSFVLVSSGYGNKRWISAVTHFSHPLSDNLLTSAFHPTVVPSAQSCDFLWQGLIWVFLARIYPTSTEWIFWYTCHRCKFPWGERGEGRVWQGACNGSFDTHVFLLDLWPKR